VQGTFAFCQEPPRQRPPRPERLFFGLFPDAGTSRRIGQFAERLVGDRRLDGTRVKDERLHISLHHVGDYWRLRSKIIYAARLAAKAVSLPPFEVTFRCVTSLPLPPSRNGRPARAALVLLGEGEALFEIYRSLGAAMEMSGLRPSPRFVPHMTLLYGSGAIPLQAVDPIRFVADELVLVHSERGLTRYHAVDRRPLGEGRACGMSAPAGWKSAAEGIS
jgi:2'-5' RNA ligase